MSPAATKPAIPIAPILSSASFRRAGFAPTATVLDAGEARLVTSGRIAIGLALREIGVGPGDTVLVPAYHSQSMVPPVLWRGATPLFYRIRPDTAPDLIDLARHIDGRTRAVMVTHYFGFIHDLGPLRALCDARGIALIEDCAHAFIGEREGRPVGSSGDYAIASSMKFFPIYEGGALVSARRPLDKVALRSAGPGFEAKVALTSLENSFSWRRLKGVQAAMWLPLKLKDGLWGALKKRRSAPAALAPSSSDSSYSFDPAWLDKRSSWFARSLLALVPAARIAALRRRNYARLDAALGSLRGVRALYPSLPPGVCPWVYPLLVTDPEPLFDRLLAAGVPVVRFGHPLWQGVDEHTCSVSADLSRRVLALPCHQELREDELAWLIDSVRKAAA
ncbi:MAG: DegT/DnrJ/EryC1/StrS family aminotransferase [Pseudomonadota bacterium]